ncbi:MAG TPA: hypothetical protein VEJ63_05730 [Planctomycetota bacterium]|nr:hypothetical protein [Planctomycetota bacterium]
MSDSVTTPKAKRSRKAKYTCPICKEVVRGNAEHTHTPEEQVASHHDYWTSKGYQLIDRDGVKSYERPPREKFDDAQLRCINEACENALQGLEEAALWLRSNWMYGTGRPLMEAVKEIRERVAMLQQSFKSGADGDKIQLGCTPKVDTLASAERVCEHVFKVSSLQGDEWCTRCGARRGMATKQARW